VLLTGNETDRLVLHHGNSAGFLAHTANTRRSPNTARAVSSTGTTLDIHTFLAETRSRRCEILAIARAFIALLRKCVTLILGSEQRTLDTCRPCISVPMRSWSRWMCNSTLAPAAATLRGRWRVLNGRSALPRGNRCGAALLTISGKLTVHDAAVHRTAERCRVDASTDPGEPTAAVAPLVKRRELTPPVTD